MAHCLRSSPCGSCSDGSHTCLARLDIQSLSTLPRSECTIWAGSPTSAALAFGCAYSAYDHGRHSSRLPASRLTQRVHPVAMRMRGNEPMRHIDRSAKQPVAFFRSFSSWSPAFSLEFSDIFFLNRRTFSTPLRFSSSNSSHQTRNRLARVPISRTVFP